MENNSVLDKLKIIYESLPPKQKKLADFIVNEYVTSAFMNATVLAREVGVSESTVTRLVSALGYLGYSGFQADCQKLVQTHISSLEKYPFNLEDPGTDIYRQVMTLEARMLSSTAERLYKEVLDQVVKLICEAEEVVVVGTLGNICLAEYTSYFLSIIGPRVHKITRISVENLMTISKLGNKSVAIVFSFPRYPQEVQELLVYLREKNVPIVGFTDSVISPIMPYTTYPCIVVQKYITFMDPFSAVFALVNALLTGVYWYDKDASKEKVEQYDKFCKSQNLLVLKDTNVIDLI